MIEGITSKAEQALNQLFGPNPIHIDNIAGDGSDRNFFRLTTDGLPYPMVIMALGPGDTQKLMAADYDWINLQAYLKSHGFRVPEIHRSLAEHGLILIEDFGPHHIEGLSVPHQRHSAYDKALDILVKFAKLPIDSKQFFFRRSFDFEKLDFELTFFCTHFLKGLDLEAQLTQNLQTELKLLAEDVANLPQILCHRDFHSRNLMIVGEDLGIIDFQDARLGPVTYDLVSLSFDAYIDLPNEERCQILDTGLGRLQATDPSCFESWPMVFLQRQLKALGSFGYLTHVTKRGDYMKYVPKALSSLLFCQNRFSAYPGTQKLLTALGSKFL